MPDHPRRRHAVALLLALPFAAAGAAGMDPGAGPDSPSEPAATTLQDLPAATFGGEARWRLSATRHPVWGDEGRGEETLFLQRYRVHADWRPTRTLRLAGELASANVTGQRGPAGPLDRNLLDVLQAYAEFAPGDTALRAGRQSLAFGSSRLIDVREGPNVRRSFDGLRLSGRQAGWQWDLLAVRPVRTRTGAFDDGTDTRQTLWGLYATRPAGDRRGALDLYYLGYAADAAVYAQGSARERRHSLGARWSGRRAGWDWNTEAVVQGGRFGTGAIRAWTLASDTGYTWRDRRGTPRLGLGLNVASGDDDRNDADLGTFNPLFPRGNYFSELALLGPRNFYNVHPFLTVHPRADLSLTIDLDLYWRLRRGDGIYAPGGRLLRAGDTTAARHVGNELSLNLTWQATPSVEITAIYAHFDPGRFVRESGPPLAIDFIELTVTMRL
ncbi:MAG TPA: alginate export family protein [Dokdonella sp.]|uniref:alginate export family protein n=1 Tax=Dokdonella sp. TaxID=2291710 RepID=UPI002B888C7C|nr:alginate export family protein [Dokdonella sp.]HUD41696.1 alginate export family protein [Dokdonella sp.]